MLAYRIALGLVMLFWPAFAHSQGLADARSFTLKLYAAYANGEPDYVGSPRPSVFSPRLLELIRRDQRLTPAGEVGVLDGDPICDCQDADGLSDVSVAVIDTGPSRARADVRFLISKDRRTVTLNLVAVRSHWRVDDVHTPAMRSLAEELRSAHPRGRSDEHAR